MSQENNVIPMPSAPKEKYKHFAKPPSSIDLVEVSQLTPMQCINMGISYFYDDDRYEDSFDEEFPDFSNCGTQPNSGNVNNTDNLNKFKEDFKEDNDDNNNYLENDSDSNIDNN